jgi:UDP-MurNAc hydroxylase
MQFKILSHACLLIKTATSSVLIDPWLVGSCYWRSWWNFPEADFDEGEVTAVDAVIISHIHWDHWHGPTLRKYCKGKPVYIPDEPGLRSEQDLRSIGFRDVCRVPHGTRVKIGDITITMYQFGLYLNDAAIVVEAGGVTLLDANDAKIAGWALEHLLQQHGPIDFALRSHSSANPRVCFKLEGQAEFANDDREHYFRSFVAFMDRVKPRYAVPFASNHCHLNDDVFTFNNYISNPLELRDYVEAHHPEKAWQLKVMLPGSRWSDDGQFMLRDERCFENLPNELAAYRARVAPALEKTRNAENRTRISDSTCAKFVSMFREPTVASSCTGPMLMSLTWPDGRLETTEIDLKTGVFQKVAPTAHSLPGKPLMLFPASIFRDAVLKNMFHHAGISKRCAFLAQTPKDMQLLQAAFAALERHEHGLYPLNYNYAKRFIRAYGRRWRELFVYAAALWHMKVRRRPIYHTEEAILRGEI